MTRLADTFARLKKEGRAAFVPFITAGERIVVRTEDASYVERAKG